MSLEGHYQNAYVTHDIDRALDLMRHLVDVGSTGVLDVTMPLTTPSGQGKLSVRVALAWTAGLQIEIIQPVSGCVDAYLPVLPADPRDATPRFHHIAVRRDDLAAMRHEIERLNLPVVFEGSGPGLTYVFVDARPQLGHYLEFVHATKEGWEMLGWPRSLRHVPATQSPRMR